jgi:hypothetical protein
MTLQESTMRILHDPTPDEILICQGQYQYLRQGTPTGLIEHWSISRLPNGSEIVRADVDARAVSGAASLLTHFQRKPNGMHEMLRMRIERANFSAAAQYDFDTAEVKTFRQGAGQIRRESLLEIAAKYVVDYHPVIAHDYVWRGYPAEAEGNAWSIPVFSPELWASDDEVLTGRALRFKVTPLPADICHVPAGEFDSPLRFEVLLSDGVRALAWYDVHGVPLRWLYPDKSYDFVLTSYSIAQS